MEDKIIIDKPKFRPELSFTLVKDDTEKTYTLHDPYNDRYFQFKDYEYTISTLLTGENNLEEICEKFEHAFDAVLPIETLTAFVQKLYIMGLLEGSPIPPKKDKYSGFLFKKFKLVNPDGFFNFLIKYLRPFYSPMAVKIFSIIVFIAFLILLYRWNELFTYGMPSFGGDELAHYGLMIIIIAFIISSHEFSHGLSLKYYGGKIPELGFMLIIFMPAVYCDVSDAWKLPKKQKLFVTFAGGFYEIVIGAFALIIWNFAEPHLWLSDISYMVVISSILTIGFNFNPLLRLDGYYLLSDFLEIPNLRQESMKYVVNLIIGKKPDPSTQEPTKREKIIFFIYGLLSSLFIIFMLSLIFMAFSGWLVETLRLSGVIISLSLLIFLVYKISKGIIKMFSPNKSNQGN